MGGGEETAGGEGGRGQGCHGVIYDGVPEVLGGKDEFERHINGLRREDQR